VGFLNVANGLLPDRITLLHSLRTSNGAGGFVDDWQTLSIVRGNGYAVHARQSEVAQAGKPTDLDIAEFVLESTAVKGEYRVQTADGRVYEIIEVQTQPPVTIVRARRVP
jgi:head-tail adaptor